VTQVNQIVAVIPGVKSAAERDLTEIHHRLLKPTLLAGLTRRYEPFNDEDVVLPGESVRVQVDAETALGTARQALSRLFDARATLDWANCAAKASVVVDGTVILDDVPVTYLLFLEKALVNIRTFLTKLPTLDPAEEWTRDLNAGAYATPETKTLRTVKVRRNHVKAEATDKHPAQVEVYTEDVAVGTWFTKKFSGALPETRRRELLDRVDALSIAVKKAREEANAMTVEDLHPAKKVFDYLFV